MHNTQTDIPCRKGDTVIFTFEDGSEEEAIVKYGVCSENKKETTNLLFASLKNGKSYLVGIDGKFVPSKKSFLKTRMKLHD